MQQLVHVGMQCSDLMLCVVLNPWHSHQPHIAQSGIAPSPNDRSLMHCGAEFDHSERASVRVSKEHESNQSINQINQIHSLHLAHLHSQQLHIPRADIAPLSNVPRLPSRLTSNHSATLTFRTFNSLAAMTIKSLGVGIQSLEYKFNPINQAINQSIKQIHSLYSSHAQRPHISQ
jgi:hypothetical protein